MDATNDQIRVLDGKGRVVGRVGEKMEFGGGDAAVLGDGVDERTREVLQGRCTVSYWAATAG